MGKQKGKGGKSRNKKKSNTQQGIPPLSKIANTFFNTEHKIDDFYQERIELKEIPTKGRGYVAKVAIPAGTLVSRSVGFIIQPNKEKNFAFLQNVAEDRKTVVTMLHLFLQKLKKTKFDSEEFEKMFKHVILNEMQPKKANFENEQSKREAELIAEEYLKSGVNKVGFPLEEIARLSLVALLNSHKIRYDFGFETDDWGVFPSASFFNHSCWPNCTAYYSKEHDEFWVRTIENIEEGEELTITYTSIFLPKPARTETLKVQYGFDCQCIKCKISDTPPGATLNNIDNRLEGFDCPEENCGGLLITTTDDTTTCDTCKVVHPRNLPLIETFNKFFGTCKSLSYDEQLEQIALLKQQATEAKMHKFHSYLYQLQSFESKVRKERVLRLRQVEPSTPLEEDFRILLEKIKAVFNIAVIILPRNHPQRAHFLLDLGTVYCVNKQQQEGLKYFKLAKKVLEVCCGKKIAEQHLGKILPRE